MTSTRTIPHLRLHSFFKFDQSSKVRWLLRELDLPFEERVLDRENDEHESPAYLALNPLGRVPVLEIDDRVVFESGAICETLADRFLDRGLAPPLESPDRGVYHQWMFFAAATLEVFQAKMMIIEDITPGELYDRKLAEVQTHQKDAIEAMERALSKGDFLVGNRFTAADIACAKAISFWRLWPELNGHLAESKPLLAYLERLEKRPAAIASEAFALPA